MSIVTINFEKAKDIKKDHLRGERVLLLEEQDILYLRAQESGADTSAIVVEKQRLRDITKQVDECADLEELSVLNCSA